MYSESELSEIKLQYETQGFVHLKQVIPAEILTRARVAFDIAAKRSIEQRQRAGQPEPAVFDLPKILDEDASFVDLVDMPTLFPVLLEVVGKDIQLNHTAARMFYPGPTFTAPWHSDISHVIGINQATTLNFHVKVHFFIEDLAADQGCLAFIPGSHRYPAGHPRPVIHDIDTSAGVVKTVPRAGDAVIFNTHVMHMATDNHSKSVRKSIIYAYSHYWIKQYDNGAPTDLERYATNEQRKQLFGVDVDGVPYFNRRIGKFNDRQTDNTILAASKTFLKRILQVKA